MRKLKNKKPKIRWNYYGKSNYKKHNRFDDLMESYLEQSGENQKALKNRLNKNKKKKGKKPNGKVQEQSQ